MSSGGAGQGGGSSPERIDRYEIRRRIGKGGQGAVYLAYDPHLDLQVALKVLSADAESADFVERFRNEARTMVRLTHPNIVRVYDYNPSHPYIVMEYCDGGDLTSILRSRETLSLGRIRRIAREVLSGIGAAHANAPTILHRDLKPGNVLFHRGVAKVADFGLAKMLGADTSLTHTRSVMGTVRYTSPEQCADPSRVDHRADIWSIGVLLHELLTWERPFDEPGDSFVNVAMRIASEPPRPPSVPLPEPLDAVIARALSKSAADRFATTEEMLAAFEEACDAVDPRGERRFPDGEAITPSDRLVREAVQLLEKGDLDGAGERLSEVSAAGGDETLARYWRQRLVESEARGGSAATVEVPATTVDAGRAEPPAASPQRRRPAEPGPGRVRAGATPASRRWLVWLPPAVVAVALAVALVALLVTAPERVFGSAGETLHPTDFIAPFGEARVTAAMRDGERFEPLELSIGAEALRRRLPAGEYRLEWGEGSSVRFEVPRDGTIVLAEGLAPALEAYLDGRPDAAGEAP